MAHLTFFDQHGAVVHSLAIDAGTEHPVPPTATHFSIQPPDAERWQRVVLESVAHLEEVTRRLEMVAWPINEADEIF